MKIKIGDSVYLQSYEVARIVVHLNDFPVNILDELFSGDAKGDCVLMTSPGYSGKFKYVFRDPTNIQWIMEQDWIIDYDEYAEAPLHEIEVLIERLRAERSVEIDDFNAKDEVYRDAHFKEVSDRIYKSSYKISSLRLLVSARKGEVAFVFPDEYRRTTDSSTATSALEKKPGFLSRLFSRSAQ